MSVKTVLVVDDNALARESLADILRVAGYLVHTAENGLEALHTLTSMVPAPDAIILDVDMPEMNGHDFVRVLRGKGRLSRLPIVLLTGESAVADELRAGCIAFLRKPVSPGIVLSVLADIAREAAAS
jgi:chemosensory pili system protein ChpA (sensor histidine kinase/response regulator)